MKRWYYVCSERNCMKKFSKDYADDLPHISQNKQPHKLKTPKDKYNLIISSIFLTNLYCMNCSHKQAHRVYYNVGNPEPYNIEFVRNNQEISDIFE